MWKTFRYIKIILKSLHSEVLFSSGDVVSGEIEFLLSKQTKVKSIILTCQGFASVSIPVPSSRRGQNGQVIMSVRMDSVKENFLFLKVNILQKSQGTVVCILPTLFCKRKLFS